MEFKQQYAAYQQAIEQYLEELFSQDKPYGRLQEAMRYSILGGGKLTMEFARLGGIDWHLALPYACALELVHNYSLIHDDLPCMDDDDLRRGQPTTHKKFGETLAVLAGDALQPEAFRLIAEAPCMSDGSRVEAVRVLARACGADGMVAGAINSTGNVLRPALQIIKTKPGSKIVSSCFIMVRPSATGENEVLAMADCAINIKPTEDELVEIAVETARTAKVFGIDPKVAFLSYSTLGSGKGEDVDKMRNACEKAKAAMPDVPVDGEFQFDAAVSPVVAKTKHITSSVGGHANTFIFPDINAGNIGYKICQRMGNFDAYGPILQGLNAPINDLSRGCNALEVYSMAIITAGLVD